MQRDLDKLTDGEFDCLVVGGGIHGAVVAYEAASRGLKTALIERGDFGQGASASSQKIAHGGIRYVRDLDFARMRRSIADQLGLLYAAPALVRPQPFLLPSYRVRGPSRFALGAGALVSNLVSSAVARRVSSRVAGSATHERDGSPTLPPARLLSPVECRRDAPDLPQVGLTGALQWHDARIVDSERLTLAFVLAAVRCGAVVANHIEAVSPLMVGHRVCGVRAQDSLTVDSPAGESRSGDSSSDASSDSSPGHSGSGEPRRGLPASRDALPDYTSPGDTLPGGTLQGGTLQGGTLPGGTAEIRARVVVNAAGSQFGHWIRGSAAPNGYGEIPFTKAVGLVIPRIQGDVALALRPNGQHPGLLGHLFLTPWQDRSIVGTAYFAGTPGPFPTGAKEEEIQALLAALNDALPEARVDRSAVRLVHCGWLPALRDGRRLATEPRVLDAHDRDGISGLVSIVGVKYTTAPSVAREVVDLIVAKLGKSGLSRSGTLEHGLCPLPRLEDGSFGLNSDVREHLLARGDDPSAWLHALLTENLAWAQPVVSGSKVIGAEVVQAVRGEMALRLTDVVLRRTELGARGYPGDAAIKACAKIMAGELDWTPAQESAEVEGVQAFYRRQRVTPFDSEAT